LVGGFYLTASPAGRVAAEKTIRDIAASGIDVQVEIVYPSDRGFGAEGYPAENAPKLSDKVVVYAGDDIDSEIKELKE
jgi:hypothetical protein